MGVTLGRTAYSPNIKERLDYSCAVFDKHGQMIAQAAHIPVHLGSMSSSIEQAIKNQHCFDGDIIILNDPYLGGTHLPDITLVAPIYINNSLEGFIANRGHHADIGGMTPGSLPLSTDVHQEGLIIPPNQTLL
jgi:N-methylhydantoinase B/acetone carboxylase, alpha subunit